MRFFLGMGAPKAGTTWLYEYLRRYPNFDFGLLKEYHVWSAVFVEKDRYLRVSEPEQLVSRGVDGRAVPKPTEFLRYQMQRREGAYEEYFRRLITGEVNSTGDFSPTNSDLPATALEQIRWRLARVGFEVKPIYLMRDPFERFWSGVRMHIRQGRFTGTQEEVMRQRLRMMSGDDYLQTLAALDSVFAPGEAYIGIYEETFTAAGLAALSQFCGVEPDVSFLQRRVNEGPKEVMVSAALRQEVIERYSEVYDYCNERFPQTGHLWARTR